MRAKDDHPIAALTALGLSQTGVLDSTGIVCHALRRQSKEVSEARLAHYADDLAVLCRLAPHIPLDFWDVRSAQMRQAGMDEYAFVQTLAEAKHAAYVRLLDDAFARFVAFRQHRATDTALAAACDLLRWSAAAVRSGAPLLALAPVPHFAPTAQSLFLWQQVLSGGTRWLPILNFPIFPHSLWSRCNVATMWQYRQRQQMSSSELWGVTGFHPDYVGAPHNTNQVEHLAMSAVLQSAYHAPLALLNLVEYAEAVLTPAVPLAERDADIALNCAIARHFLPDFTLAGAEAAADHLHAVLAAPAQLEMADTPTKRLLMAGALGLGITAVGLLGGRGLMRTRRARLARPAALDGSSRANNE